MRTEVYYFIMGNQQSTEDKKSTGSRSGTPQAEKDRKVNRRISIQALSQGRGSPVDAAATKDTAVAQTTSQRLEKPYLQPYLQSSSPDSAKSGHVERSGSRTSKDERKKQEVENRPRHQVPNQPPLAVPQPASPLDVPISKSKQDEDRFDERPIAHSQPYDDRRYAPVAQNRPPRLPLPIADVSIPESPTLMPVDKSGDADVPLFDTDGPLSSPEPHIRRRSSMMSTNTQSEDEVAEELQPYGTESTTHTTPTVIEWNQGGGKVYVTGTFANWEKKYRLHPRLVNPVLFFGYCLGRNPDFASSRCQPGDVTPFWGPTSSQRNVRILLGNLADVYIAGRRLPACSQLSIYLRELITSNSWWMERW